MNPRAIRQRERRARLRAAASADAANAAAFAAAFPLDAAARARLAAAEDAPAAAAAAVAPAAPAATTTAATTAEDEEEVPEEPHEQEIEPDRPPPPVIPRRENLGPPNLPNDVNAPTQLLKYHAILLEMMSHFTQLHHPSNKVFSSAELSIIEPIHIYTWMCYRAFGLEDPGPEDNPYYARASTLEFWKKAISYFMPLTSTWDDTKEEGNPTKSRKINNLIKAVKKKEARMLGRTGQADRAFTLDEFIQMLDLIGPAPTIVNLRHRAMLKFQFHLIGRGDDTSHMRKASIRESLTYPGYLTAQMRWSKNVQEEKDCPLQLLMGSLDPRFCVLLGLAVYLETWHSHGAGRISQWLFAEGDTRAGSSTKRQDKEADICKFAYQRAMKSVLVEGGHFRFAGDKQLGTHSVKKWATTMSQRCGAPKDDVNYRARWKTSKAMQDQYLEIQLDWPDINAASRLCHRGVCVYKERDDSSVTDQWLAASVTPAIRGAFGDRVAVILAKPLLWACYDANAADLVPPDLRQLIVNRYSLLNRTEAEVNPIRQIRIIPSNHDGVVHMDEIPDEDTADREGGFGRGGQEWRNAIYAKICTTQTNVAEIKNHQLTELAEIKRQLRTLTAMVRGLSYDPARRAGGGGGGGGGRCAVPQGVPNTGKPATLYPHPRTIEAMWDEYQNGIGGRKPARDFSRRERGSCKFKFARRKLIWDAVERLLDMGNDLSTACNKIRRVFGDVSMTRLINLIWQDKNSAVPNPDLR